MHKNYLEFFGKVTIEDRLKIKHRISKFCKGIEIADKNLIKKKVKIQKAILPFKLENGKTLLIGDRPINFLLCISIVVGDGSKLVEFEDETGNKFICQEDLILILKQKISIKNLEPILPSELSNLKFEKQFETLEIINNLIKLNLKKNHIDLKKIHIISCNKLEIFNPTIKRFHFKIAEKLNLKLENLIENSLIKDTKVNVSEFNKILKIIKPLLIYTDLQSQDFLKNNTLPVYKDLTENIFLTFHPKDIISKFETIDNSNVPIEELMFELANKTYIQLNETNSDIPIPVYVKNRNNKIFPIKNNQDFSRLSGMIFKLDSVFLSQIIFQDLQGGKVEFGHFNLKEKYTQTLFQINNSKTLYYKTLDELTLKLFFVDNPKEIFKIETFNKNIISELIKHLKNLIKQTVLISIKFNKIPTEIKPNSLTQSFFSSQINSLHSDYTTFKNSHSKVKLLKRTNSRLREILLIINHSEKNFEDLYFYNQISLILIKILSEFDLENSKIINDLFHSYFKKETLKINENLIDNKLEELFLGITLANKIAKKKRTFVIISNQNCLTFLSKKVIVLETPKFSTISKINLLFLKKLFPYSYKNIGLKIKNENLKIGDEIILGKRNITIKEEYFKEEKIYEDYKLVYVNSSLKILLRRNPKKPILSKPLEKSSIEDK